MLTDQEIICFVSGYLCPNEQQEEDAGIFGGSLLPSAYVLAGFSVVFGLGFSARWAYRAYKRYQYRKNMAIIMQIMEDEWGPEGRSRKAGAGNSSGTEDLNR